MMFDFYGNKLLSFETPCSCCGANYTEKIPKRITAGFGISIILGKCGSNTRRRKTQLDHVETKNGTMTIVVQTIDKR